MYDLVSTIDTWNRSAVPAVIARAMALRGSPTVHRAARVRLLRKWSVGPALYTIAIAAAFVSTWIAVAIYIIVPAFFLVPRLQEGVLEDLQEEPARAG